MLYFLLRLSLILSLSFSSAKVQAASQHSQQWAIPTTHSPLTAFKQLGFDNNGYRPGGQHAVVGGHPQSPSYIPYSISDFSDPPPSSGQKMKLHNQPRVKNSDLGSNSAEGFQQKSHPNDILSNMGVDLPSEEILGKLHDYFLYIPA